MHLSNYAGLHWIDRVEEEVISKGRAKEKKIAQAFVDDVCEVRFLVFGLC